MGDDVIGAVKEFFNQRSSLTSINQIFIALIPKIRVPKVISDFRPICLCNVFYKIISKTLANKIKEVFSKIIFPHQSAFIKGRQMSDNILIAHKVLQFLRKDKSNNNHMAIKLNMSKAYDRVEWHIILAMMEQMGFNEKWKGWIKECMGSVLIKPWLMVPRVKRFLPREVLDKGIIFPLSFFCVVQRVCLHLWSISKDLSWSLGSKLIIHVWPFHTSCLQMIATFSQTFLSERSISYRIVSLILVKLRAKL